jgi:hypothetical protein
MQLRQLVVVPLQVAQEELQGVQVIVLLSAMAMAGHEVKHIPLSLKKEGLHTAHTVAEVQAAQLGQVWQAPLMLK